MPLLLLQCTVYGSVDRAPGPKPTPASLQLRKRPRTRTLRKTCSFQVKRSSEPRDSLAASVLMTQHKSSLPSVPVYISNRIQRKWWGIPPEPVTRAPPQLRADFICVHDTPANRSSSGANATTRWSGSVRPCVRTRRTPGLIQGGGRQVQTDPPGNEPTDDPGAGGSVQ